MTDFIIDVIVDTTQTTSGMDKIDGRLNKLEKSGQRLRQTLTRAITLVGIVAAAKQLGSFADTLTNASNRIRLVTKDTKELNVVMQRLFDISARTRTGFASTATIFSRTALAVKDLGLSLQETLDFTEALNQAIVLSGVKAQEANAGLIQLSQGLASGTLRGDELRSVLEQLPKVADLIADQLGVLRGELRILGEQGKISTKQIIEAFTGLAAKDLIKAFGDSIPTISQGFTVLHTRVIQYVGAADAATGTSEKLARSLIFIAEHLETIGKIAIVAGAALVGPFAKAGVLFATRAVQALTVAILANPIGALVVGVSAGIAALVQFGDQITVSEDGLLSLKDVALGVWDTILEGIQPVVDFMTEGFEIAINFVIESFKKLGFTFDDILGFARTVVNGMIGHFVGLSKALSSVFNDVREIIIDVIGDDLLKTVGALVKGFIDFLLKGLEVISAFVNKILEGLGLVATQISETISGFELPDVDSTFVGNMTRVGKNAAAAYLEGFEEDYVGGLVATLLPAFEKVEANARKISAKRRAPASPEEGVDLTTKGVVNEQKPFAFRELVRLLNEEAKNLSLVNRERGVQNELLKAEEKLRSSNVTLTEPLRDELEALIRNITALREKAAVLDSIRAPQDEIIARQSALNTLYAEGAISLAELTTEMLALGSAQAELNIMNGEGSFADGFLLSIETMLESVRNFSSEAGALFGDFFTQSSEGFATAIGDAIVFGTSIKDAVGAAARQALAGLLSGLIKLGIQYALNATLGQTMAAATTAAGVAQAATLATAFATPAALVSLASFGANAAPAQAGILSTVAVSTGVAALGFKDGGFVSGAGTGRSDSINANLSNGEFVVNAKSTARFRPQLEAMNAPAAAGGDPTSQTASNGADGSNGSSGGGEVNVINVFDPNMLEEYLTTSSGEKTLVNVIERNSSSINQVLRN